MMAHPSGIKIVGPCPYCGLRYKLTNFMRRSRVLQQDDKGRWLHNTHLIACYRKSSTPEKAK